MNLNMTLKLMMLSIWRRVSEDCQNRRADTRSEVRGAIHPAYAAKTHPPPRCTQNQHNGIAADVSDEMVS